MDILYHYCSTSAFLAIVESRQLRLSSLLLSNDTLEGKIVANVFSKLAEHDGLEAATRQRLQEMLSSLEKITDGLGFCMSEDGDLLSQWRGYASDATGVSIGFSRTYLEWLAQSSHTENAAGLRLSQVKYESHEHQLEVHPTYAEAKRLIDAGVFRLHGFRTLLDVRSDEEIEHERKDNKALLYELSLGLLMLFPKLFLLKSPAFREEKEWRLLSHLNLNDEEPCKHRVVENRLIPYRTFELVEPARGPIVEVVLGPKQFTPPNVIERFLKQYGFEGVVVKCSEASYR